MLKTILDKHDVYYKVFKTAFLIIFSTECEQFTTLHWHLFNFVVLSTIQSCQVLHNLYSQIVDYIPLLSVLVYFSRAIAIWLHTGGQ